MTWIVASSAAAVAVPTKPRIFTRETGTPTLRAAVLSPPVQVIQLPKTVLVRT